MISRFESAPLASPAPTSKGSNAILYILVGAVVLYLGYKYVIKPQMDKAKAEENK